MKRLLFMVVAILLLASVTVARAENVKLRFGILPVLDTLPLQVAQAEGLFEAQELDVELIRFASALERDTAMQAGQLDGYFGDLVATYLLIGQGVPMRIATTSWRTTPGAPMFGIALAPGFKDATLADLKGRKIGLSKSTVMEFLVDKMEPKLGLNPGHFERVEIKKIPIRMQTLLTDTIETAILPEPLLSLVKLKGGGILATSENLDVPLTVHCLHDRYFQNGGAVYTKFLTAYSEAVRLLAAKPEAYRDLMAETCRIPPPLIPAFPVYAYPQPSLPTEAELDEVQTWMMGKGLLKRKVDPATVLPPVKP